MDMRKIERSMTNPETYKCATHGWLAGPCTATENSQKKKRDIEHTWNLEKHLQVVLAVVSHPTNEAQHVEYREVVDSRVP
jgi:hypothetical protein